MYFSFINFLSFLSVFFFSFCVCIMSDLVFCVPMWKMFSFLSNQGRQGRLIHTHTHVFLVCIRNNFWGVDETEVQSPNLVPRQRVFGRVFLQASNQNVLWNCNELICLDSNQPAVECPHWKILPMLEIELHTEVLSLVLLADFLKDVGSFLGVFVYRINTWLFRLLQNQMSKVQRAGSVPDRLLQRFLAPCCDSKL